MRLELKLALIGAISKIVIFILLFVLMQQFIDNQALNHTDRDLVKMKDKTISIVEKIGINSFLNIERDSVYASYNMLKDEYISIDIDPSKGGDKLVFSNEAREIEDEDFDYRILNYRFEIKGQHYVLEIGKSVQLINSLNKMIQNISISIILLVLLMTIMVDIGINKYLLTPLNKMIIGKLKTITDPESFDFSALNSSTSDFVSLNNALNELMYKVSTILKNQQRFTANVSHELFTPISVMQSKLENLLLSNDLPEHFIANILDQQEHLNRLQQIIKALLLIARIENDQFAKDDSLNLKQLIEEIILNIEDRAQMRNISIENNIPSEQVLGRVNKSLVYILLFNLISNAIKYNKDNGKIQVSCFNDDLNFCLEISDSGIGIDKDQISTIFDRFKRAGPLAGEGYGLGLSIVKSIVLFHQGDIKVRSEPGIKTTFTVHFPLKDVNEFHSA